jgi:hypothetical protein
MRAAIQSPVKSGLILFSRSAASEDTMNASSAHTSGRTVQPDRRFRITLARLASTLAVTMIGAAAVPPALAQTGSSIAGIVKDASGGVLPGVTVEAASPALIEGTRTAVSDANGQYKIVDLRPGEYTVTFTLTGFGPFKREGLALPASFTASVNAELSVGTLAEALPAAPGSRAGNSTPSTVLSTGTRCRRALASRMT